MSVLDNLPRPFFVLAPMDDVTDTVFRQVIAGCAPPDVYFTEFVNVDGLQSPGRDNLMKKLRFSAKERPIIAQVWGLQPENFRKTAVELVQMGFAGIDINMGCPEKTVVKNGACAGLMHNRELAVEIIKATQEGAAGKVPVSVKTRTGFTEVDLTWPTLLLQQKLNMLTIHGRTRKEMSKVPADWPVIAKIRELRDKLAPDTLIVGNGDVESRQQGLDLAKKYKLDGIMVGRGMFHDPFLFSKSSPWKHYSDKQRIELYTKHVKLFAKTWENGERPVHTLNKFCKVYINGFEGAKELRERLMAARSTEELLGLLKFQKVEATAG
ncbi:MAG TPA: tRNA-dihydrouridine synthase [Patescibacteria group bacterium]|nr:tRNA-dihydrouridine synthase [Patescibacteria group bacterium]